MKAEFVKNGSSQGQCHGRPSNARTAAVTATATTAGHKDFATVTDVGIVATASSASLTAVQQIPFLQQRWR